MKYISRLWFSSISFFAGFSTSVRVLALLVAILSLPVSGPMILVAAAVMGIKNAFSRGGELQDQDKEVERLSALLESLNDEKALLLKEYNKKHHEYHQIEAYNARLEQQKEELYALLATLNFRITQAKDYLKQLLHGDPEARSRYASGLYEKINATLAVIEHTPMGLTQFAEQKAEINNLIDQITLSLPAPLQHTPTPLHAYHQEQATTPQDNTPTITQAPPTPTVTESSWWGKTWNNAKKLWSVASVGIGSGVFLFILLHFVGIFFAVPTGGLSLGINIAVSLAFGVGSSILFTSHVASKKKELNALQQQTNQLEKTVDHLKGKSKRAEKKLTASQKKSRDLERDHKQYWQQVKSQGDQLKIDLETHQQPKSSPRLSAVPASAFSSQRAEKRQQAKQSSTLQSEKESQQKLLQQLSQEQHQLLTQLYQEVNPEQAQVLTDLLTKATQKERDLLFNLWEKQPVASIVESLSLEANR